MVEGFSSYLLSDHIINIVSDVQLDYCSTVKSIFS